MGKKKEEQVGTNERLVRVSAGKVNPRTTRELVEALTEIEVVEMNCIGRDEWVMLFASEVEVGMWAGEVVLEGGTVEACVTVEEWMGMEALVRAEAAKRESEAGSESRYKGRVWPCTPLMFDMEEVKKRFLAETRVSEDQLLVWRRNVVEGVAESSWWFETASWPDGVKFHSWDMMSYRRTKVRVTAVCITLGSRKRKRTKMARVHNRKVGGVEEAATWMEERKRAKGRQAEGTEGTSVVWARGKDQGPDVGGVDER